MSNYARSTVFPEPNPLYGLNRRSYFKIIRFFRAVSRLSYGLSSTSYYERRFSLGLGIRSYSWNEYGRALDDLVTKEIEPLTWRSIGSYKISLDTYSSICYNRKNGNFYES